MALSSLMPKLLVAGGLGFDTIKMPRGTKKVLGGTGLHSAVAASFFTRTALLSAVGKDFTQKNFQVLNNLGIDISGILVLNERSKNFVTQYNDRLEVVSLIKKGMSNPESIRIQGNLRGIKYVFLGGLNPILQLNIISQMAEAVEIGIDTKLSAIKEKREEFIEAVRKSNILFLNKEEARFLGESSNLSILFDRLSYLGPKNIVIKLGKDGAAMFSNGRFISVPAFSTKIIEPTGAGDSFGGAFMGYLAQKGDFNYINAFVAGNVMASFNVEGFGAERIFRLNRFEFDKRASFLRKLIKKQ